MSFADLGAHVLGDTRLAFNQVALAVKAWSEHGVADAHLEIEDVQDHLQEYATVMAMGYNHGYLRNVVLQEAIILAVLGFLPGMAVAYLVFSKGADATRLPLEMSVQSALGVFVLTLAMCAGSGLLALRKLRAVDPAEVF